MHRIGRTGRAGAAGHAISFATPDQRSDVYGIERLMRSTLPLSKVPELPPARAEHFTPSEFVPQRRSGASSSGGARRPSYGNRPAFGTSKPAYSPRPSYGSAARPSYGSKPSYGTKPSYGSSSRPSSSGGSASGGARKPFHKPGGYGGSSPRRPGTSHSSGPNRYGKR